MLCREVAPPYIVFRLPQHRAREQAHGTSRANVRTSPVKTGTRTTCAADKGTSDPKMQSRPPHVPLELHQWASKSQNKGSKN